MGFDVPRFLKKDKQALIFNEDNKELVYFVPEKYFESDLATPVGEYINLMGIFDYTIMDSKGKNSGLKRFYFPTIFVCKPYTMEKMKQIKLTSYTEPQDYRLLKFKKGDQAVTSVTVPKSVANIELFSKMFIFNRLPNTIPYDKIVDYFIDNIRLNGADYGVTIQMLGLIVGEACRDSKDVSKRFRNTDMKNMNDYKMMPIKKIPKLVSPFTAITSENWDESVIAAVQNKNKVNAPLEKLLMG